MTRIGGAIAVAVAVSVLSGSALAADISPIIPPIAAPVAAPASPPSPGFTFAGPYVGAFGGALQGRGYDLGLQAGFNFVRGRVLIGVEAEVGAMWWMTWGAEAGLSGRLGAAFGDRFLAYGEVGVGVLFGMATYTAGGGLELALGRNVSVFGEARAVNWFNGGFEAVQLRAGVNWHPNR